MDYSSNWSGPDPTLTVEQFELLLNQGDVLATIVAGNRICDFLEKNGWGVARQIPQLIRMQTSVLWQVTVRIATTFSPVGV